MNQLAALFTFRSFSKNDKRKLGVWAFVSCSLMVISFYALPRAYLSPLPATLNLETSRNVNIVMSSVVTSCVKKKAKGDARISSQKPVTKPKKFGQRLEQICNLSDPRSDYCEIKGDVRVHGNSSTIFIASPSRLGNNLEQKDAPWRIRPYARKGDYTAMGRTREFSLIASSAATFSGRELIVPNCSKNHRVPGILFSSGGYAGNHFHDFSDVVIPLYVNSRHLKRKVKFLVTDMKPWWLAKFRVVLRALSKYDVIDIDKNRQIHCFRSLIVGLRASNKELSTYSPMASSYGISYTIGNFTSFLRSAYSLQRDTAIQLSVDDNRKPRLLIILRKRTRVFINKDEIEAEARILGYEVVATEAMENLDEFAKVVNSVDVMVGMHGAGLTNFVFLPQRAVVVQVVPLGLEWLAKNDYEVPALSMNLRHLEYKINANESTLSEQYPRDDPVLTSPSSVLTKRGWPAFKPIYLDRQNVRLDVSRFRSTLWKALDLLHER
ncbi:Alpha-1,3-arabinosyltransferase XAT3-like protein [Drosera capensis]